jgi:hypothetical protein
MTSPQEGDDHQHQHEERGYPAAEFARSFVFPALVVDPIDSGLRLGLAPHQHLITDQQAVAAAAVLSPGECERTRFSLL